MKNLLIITAIVILITFVIAAFMGGATFGLVFLSILSLSSLAAIGFAGWKNRSNITTTYSDKSE